MPFPIRPRAFSLSTSSPTTLMPAKEPGGGISPSGNVTKPTAAILTRCFQTRVPTFVSTQLGVLGVVHHSRC